MSSVISSLGVGSRKLWIVCPCFFDGASFTRLREVALETVSKTLPDFNVTFLLIDDSGGMDSEIKDLKRFSNVQIITLPYNMGHQGALVYGLRTMSEEVDENDFVLTMDSDGEDRPVDIPAMLGAILSVRDQKSPVSLALRTRRHESLPFKIGYFFFKIFFRVLTGKIIQNGNYAAFRGWFLKEIIFHPHFDQCYSSGFISLPLKIQFVPLERGTRYFGQSKMSYFALITHGLRMLMPFTERIAVRGVVAASVLSVASLALPVMALQFSPIYLVFAVFCSFLFVMMTCLFVLLFATFSQSKAVSLRNLRNLNVPKFRVGSG